MVSDTRLVSSRIFVAVLISRPYLLDQYFRIWELLFTPNFLYQKNFDRFAVDCFVKIKKMAFYLEGCAFKRRTDSDVQNSVQPLSFQFCPNSVNPIWWADLPLCVYISCWESNLPSTSITRNDLTHQRIVASPTVADCIEGRHAPVPLGCAYYEQVRRLFPSVEQ